MGTRAKVRVFGGQVSVCTEQRRPRKRMQEAWAPGCGAGPGLGGGCGGCDIMGYRSLTFRAHTCGVYSGLGVREGMALPPCSPG